MESVFSYLAWHERIRSSIGASRAFHYMMLDGERYLTELSPFDDWESLTAVDQAYGTGDLADDEYDPYFYSNLYDAFQEFQLLKKSYQLFCDQEVVYAATLFEGMIKEFLRALFQRKNDLMYPHIGHEGVRGRVSLKVISKSDTLQDLIQSLAHEAAEKVYQKSYVDMIKTVEKLSKHKLEPDGLADDVAKVLGRRNEVVHGSPSGNGRSTPSEAIVSLWVAGRLAEHLFHVAMLNEIPVDGIPDHEVAADDVCELTWRHTGTWPGDTQWRFADEQEDLLPEVTAAFGASIDFDDRSMEGAAVDSNDYKNLLRSLGEYARSHLF